jgi:putative DNA primase/helicase
MAQTEMEIGISSEELDRNQWLLNVNNGTIDLATGKLDPHDKDNFITKIAPVDYSPKAKCPQWDKFLSQIMKGNRAMIDFLQRAIGYSLTGDMREHATFFLHGNGANGKSTFLNLIREILGDYGRQAAPELLVNKLFSTHPTDIAELQGRRFVVAMEVDDGKRLAEAFVKQITGGDNMSARRMYEDNIEFTPVCKIFIATNHMPIIRGTDDGIKRRITCVPFDAKFSAANQDKQLIDKLRTEKSGILAWAVRGCLAWQKHGLNFPDTVKDATASYQKDMDVNGTFITEICNLGPKEKVKSERLYLRYSHWCDENEEFKQPLHAFKKYLKERGYVKKRQSEGYFWYGIGLK